MTTRWTLYLASWIIARYWDGTYTALEAINELAKLKHTGQNPSGWDGRAEDEARIANKAEKRGV